MWGTPAARLRHSLLLQCQVLGCGRIERLQPAPGQQLLELLWGQQVLQAVLKMHSWCVCSRAVISTLASLCPASTVHRLQAICQHRSLAIGGSAYCLQINAEQAQTVCASERPHHRECRQTERPPEG